MFNKLEKELKENIVCLKEHIVCFKGLILLPKTKKFGCVGRGDLTSLFFSKVTK